MLIKVRVWFPEIFFGMLLAVAIFALGAGFESSRHHETKQPPQAAAEQIQNANKPEPFSWDWLTADGTVFFTGVLSLIAGIQAALFLWQLRYMRKGMRDAEIAAKAASDSAAATKDTVALAKDTAQRQLRAYVLVSGARIFDGLDPAKRRVQLSIRNFGQTPAHDLEMWMGVAIRDYPLTVDLGEPPKDLPTSIDVLGPGIPFLMELPVAPLDEPWRERDFLRTREGAIFVYGQVTYRDVFNVRHVTDFRQMCFGEDLGTGHVSPCEVGNKYT